MALVFTKSAEISLFTLTGSDRLGRFIASASIKRPFTCLFLACLFGLIPPFMGWIEGNWSNPALELDISRDLGWWNQFLLAFPAMVYIAGSYFGAFPKTLRQLVDAGVILATEEDWKAIRRSTKNYINHPVVTFFPYVFGLLFVFASTILFLSTDTWIDVRYFAAGWLVPFYVFLLYYLLAFIALRIVGVYLVLQKLFRLKVNIQPFHQDGCGGLVSLSDLSSRLTFSIMIFGIIMAMAMYINIAIYALNPFGVYNLGMFGMYLVVAILSFFLPLYATSARMKDAKLQMISQINDRTEKLSNAENLARSDQKNLEEYGDEDLRALESLEQTVRTMQVWPFTPSAIAKFAASIAIPVLVLSSQLFMGL